MHLQLTIDCHDPAPLVPFWCLALGYVPEPPPDGAATWRDYYLAVGVPEDELGEGDCQDRIVDPAGQGPKIWFQPVPESKTVKNRLHLDILVGGRGMDMPQRRALVFAKAQELVAAGATQLRILEEFPTTHVGITMQDPEGNEFCLT